VKLLIAIVLIGVTSAAYAQQRPTSPDPAWIASEIAKTQAEIQRAQQIYIDARLKQLRSQGTDDAEAALVIEKELSQ
jgi:hypothetical protein